MAQCRAPAVSRAECSGSISSGASSKSWFARFQKVTSLQDEALLHGVPAFRVLAGCGQLLRQGSGSAETYNLSRPVAGIGTFISHNWSTSWRSKWAVLALFFNFSYAVALTVVTLLLLGVLTALGTVPLFAISDHNGVDRARGAYCLGLGSLVFWITIFSGHEVGARLGIGPSTFLDRACISQADPVLKRRGIERLAAFIDRSGTLLVVYSDAYLRKLWTVYELATALILLHHIRVVVVPLFMPKLVVVGNITWLIFLGVDLALLLPTVREAEASLGLDATLVEFIVFSSLLLPATAALDIALRQWVRHQVQIDACLQAFSIQTAACSVEADRTLVQQNIAAFMKSVGMIPAQALDREAMAAFDRFVRLEVPGMVAASFGRVGVPYKYVVAIFLSQGLRGVDGIAALIRNKEEPRKVAISVVEYAVIHLANLPMGFALLYRVVRLKLGLRGPLEWALLGVASLGICLLGERLWSLLRFLRVSAHTSDLGLALLLCYGGALFVLTRALYGPLPTAGTRATSEAAQVAASSAEAETGSGRASDAGAAAQIAHLSAEARAGPGRPCGATAISS